MASIYTETVNARRQRELRGTKRLVSVHVCSTDGNSAGFFISKVSPGIFVIKARHGQSIKIDIGKPIDKSITINKANLIIIDCIDQSIKVDTHTVPCLNCYRFYQLYRPQGWFFKK